MQYPWSFPKKLSFLILISAFLFVSCSGSSGEKTGESQTTERPEPDSLQTARSSVDTLVDDLASIIAGFVPKVYTNKKLSDQDYLVYRSKVEKDWAGVVQYKTEPIARWREMNIPVEKQDSSTLFYPFAGADFLYANTFFPDCRNYILVGLEPVGNFMRCDTLAKADMLSYLEKIRSSLYFSNHLGFFRTESMQKDLHQATLDGTLPLITFYVKRTHHLIRRIAYFSLDSAGIAVECKADCSPVGARIDFCDSTLAKNQSVYYLSFDLSEKNLTKHKEFLAFVKNFGHQQIFLKAASYLMFSSNFRTIRNYLLDNAGMILQDDSGIPYRFFKPEKWNVQLFGTYTKTIDLFEQKFQPDLEEVYAKLEKPQPVPFRIGYNVKFNETNLLLAKRKD
jgi:hypothetical protein